MSQSPFSTDPHDQPTERYLAGSEEVHRTREDSEAACAAADSGLPPTNAPRTQPNASASTLFEHLREFGDYEILCELGRGGMGVVFKAVQRSLGRTVALKMILGGKLASEEDLKRFLMEAEASARLQHRNIVTLYEVGEIEGQHYFSMEYIEGESLAQKLAAGPLPCRVAARYIQTVARALHFAHTQGFLHRDLKPSNIMVDRDDEPRVMDFGLAKNVDGDGSSLHTQTGAILGTPSYMSPEQASGKVRDIGPASDVYGLGAVLYELLTGRPPFRSDNPLDTLLHVIQSEPVPPRLLNPKIDHDLETICLKCLEKDPANRYPTAEALADDLGRYLQGESISARSFNVIDRLTRALERSQHDVAFHAWSDMLFVIAAIIFAEHLLIFALSRAGAADVWLLLARASQFVLLGLVFWWKRKAQLLPRTPAERELWTIWLGYLVSYGAAFVVVRSLLAHGILTVRVEHESLVLYPLSSLLSGLAFFIMGSNYWGRCYAIGLAFVALAMISTLHIEWAPLEFGVLWGVSLVSLGFRLRHLEEEARREKPQIDAEAPAVSASGDGEGQ